jgi:hypothetical protein
MTTHPSQPGEQRTVRLDDELGIIFSTGDTMPWPTYAPDSDWRFMKTALAALAAHAQSQARIAELAQQVKELREGLANCEGCLRQVGAPDGSLAIITADEAAALLRNNDKKEDK